MLPGKVPNTLISIATAVSKTNITTGCRSGHGPARSAFSSSHLIAYEELLVRYKSDIPVIIQTFSMNISNVE